VSWKEPLGPGREDYGPSYTTQVLQEEVGWEDPGEEVPEPVAYGVQPGEGEGEGEEARARRMLVEAHQTVSEDATDWERLVRSWYSLNHNPIALHCTTRFTTTPNRRLIIAHMSIYGNNH